MFDKVIDIQHAPKKFEKERRLNSSVFCRINVGLWEYTGQRPMFSLNLDTHDYANVSRDDVLLMRPDLEPVHRLVGCWIDGSPSYDVENAVHWVSGILLELPGFPYRPNSSKTDFDKQTPSYCLEILGKHLRTDPNVVIAAIKQDLDETKVFHLYQRRCLPTSAIRTQVKKTMTKIVEVLRTQWRQEAELALSIIKGLP